MDTNVHRTEYIEDFVFEIDCHTQQCQAKGSTTSGYKDQGVDENKEKD